MFDATEIYICRYGQRLQEGALLFSHEVHNRTQAEEDARELCVKDRTIHRIAYYAVNEHGDFRHFHTYVNPEVLIPEIQDPPDPGMIGPIRRRSKVVVDKLRGWLGRQA